MVWWTIARRQELRPRIEVVPGEEAIATRAVLPRVGDRVRIAVEPTDEVRIYHGDDLVLRCPAGATAERCRSDAHGMVAEARLAASGDYRLVVITLATAEPVGRLDLDLGAIVAAGGSTRSPSCRSPDHRTTGTDGRDRIARAVTCKT